MEAFSVSCIFLVLFLFGFAVWLDDTYYAPKITEERKNKLITFAQNVAEEYQGKKLRAYNKRFLIEEDNGQIELLKEHDCFVFRVSLEDQETSRQIQIKFPAKDQDGTLKIELEYPSVDDGSLEYEHIKRFELLIAIIIMVLVVVSIIF